VLNVGNGTVVEVPDVELIIELWLDTILEVVG